MMYNLQDRDIRQRELVPPDRLSKTGATVVGVGAIGRQVAMQLSSIGVPKITLIDFDIVNIENLACQGFYPSDIGEYKVEAVKRVCEQINPDVDIYTANSKFKANQFRGSAFFCCVDKIDTRKKIFRLIKNLCTIFIDGRMSAEYARILTVFDPDSKDSYETTLFPQSEAYRGSCTAKSTIYCSNVVAGIMVAQFAKWLRGGCLDKAIDINLLTNEMGTN